MKKHMIRLCAVVLLALLSLSLFACKNENPPAQGTVTLEPSRGFANVPNEDGVITGSGYIEAEKSGSLFDSVLGIFSSDAKKASADASYSAEVAAEAGSPELYLTDGTYIKGDMDVIDPIPEPYYPGESDIQIQYNAGTLTAGEWRDNKSWSDWLTKLSAQEWTSISEKWGIIAKNRVCVHVTNGTEAVKNADVVIYDEANNALWSAVTDYEGCAYLFWSDSGVAASPNYPNAGTPKSVKVSAAGAEAVSAAYNGEETLEVNVAATNAEKKLDLMFVVDTTGSMGDELEYLKVELKDVVTRAASASGAVVRTSVNFYRDEGDEYIVKYFKFNDNIDDAVANISAQSANGGGDYPEAVHSALDNAIFAHAWDEGDSVKLLFLILDAPPHADSAVMESLTKSVEAAAARGIRIIPVLSSGTDTECEVLFRSIAAVTGGTYSFLTDHSGVGGAHAEQSVGEFTVEKLNDLMVRIITEYCS